VIVSVLVYFDSKHEISINALIARITNNTRFELYFRGLSIGILYINQIILIVINESKRVNNNRKCNNTNNIDSGWIDHIYG